MDVGYNNASGFPTVYPEIAKQPAVDLDDSGIQGVRIYIVVEDELLDSPGGALGAEQKRAALACATGTSPEFGDTSAPDSRATEDLGWRSEETARERCY